MPLDWRGQRDRNQELVAAATGGGRGLAEFSRTDRDIVGTLTTDAFAINATATLALVMRGLHERSRSASQDVDRTSHTSDYCLPHRPSRGFAPEHRDAVASATEHKLQSAWLRTRRAMSSLNLPV
jgi:hypothetical protein